MMTQMKTLTLVGTILAAVLVAPLAASAASAAEANICNLEEFWEGECQSSDEWTAGWYLHQGNDPGDGSAVETAYANFARVIENMPHSMCIDWRTANCDGAIPPDAPNLDEENATRNRRQAGSVKRCIRQANTRSSIDLFCRALYAYDLNLDAGDQGFDPEKAADKQTFLAGLTSRNACVVAAANITTNADDYSDGFMTEAQEQQMEDDIATVQAWACVVGQGETPPTIPDAPGS